MTNNRTLNIYTGKDPCQIFSVRSFTAQQAFRDMHRHSFFQIVLLEKGKMRHWIDFNAQDVEAPYASVVFPKQMHRMEMDEDAEAKVIMFDETVFCSAILSNELKDYNINLVSRLNHVSDIPLSLWDEINAQLRGIMVMLPTATRIREMQAKFMIKIILLKIIDVAPHYDMKGTNDADVQLYQMFLEKVNHEFVEHKKVAYYTEALGVTRKKLSAVCMRYAGQLPLQIIHDKLSLELKKVIIEEGLMMKEIAFRFRFSSQSALNKYIERYFGCSPNRWRAELENNMQIRKKK